ncbi:ABC transporter substrate-binding protein [Microbacterium enclense]|uniref:Raffinose/stachyose/melibiose transport system substrate-binding protein n=1 Tax=Microbacterium enclense TaxID=993073 RepID=A0A1G6JI47_9MICO|nr:ABC transporter substrate-binding protein [Microbacterium enclense]KSU54835.1 hypothetical protein AS029_07765 [Microbacterium enclense]SDC17596.1 raffinose/stachyose/melibiose transport system substrate-binding protein [Microbacterium enclense]
MRTTRKVAAALTVGAVALTAAGCSSASSGSGDAQSITIWHNSADNDGIMALYEGFTAETGIQVNLEAIPADGFETAVTTKWATGDRPDVLEYHPTASALALLNASQNMQDLSDMEFVGKSGSLYEQAGNLNGTVYAAITGFPSIFGIFFNKEVLASAGVEAPQTFDELITSCGALKSAGVVPFYESGGSQWPTQILPFLYMADENEGNELGYAFSHNEKQLNGEDSPFVAGLDKYLAVRDACFDPNYTTGTFENAIAEVYAGTAAMTALHSDTYNLWVDAAGGDEDALSAAVGFAGLSKDSATAAFGPGPLGSYMAPKTGDAGKEAAAKQFIEYATGKGYADLIATNEAFPVIEGYDAPAGAGELKLAFKAAYDDGATIGSTGDIAGFDNFPAEVSRLLAGEITAQQLADAMQANVDRASKAAGVEGW